MCAFLLLAACYQPEVRDCTVTCAHAGDCADGQVCGRDGYCAAPAVAGTCGFVVDAATSADASPSDAPPSDAGTAQLHVIVQGRGKVSVDPLGMECTGTNTADGDCMFDVPSGASEMLTPVQTNPQSSFVDWTTANCAGMTACTVTVDPPVTLVTAMFSN
jgi:hypothetical protein